MIASLLPDLASFGFALEGFFHGRQIGQSQFGLYGFDVRDRIHIAADVHDVVIDKAAHHVDDAIGFTDGGKKLVSQPFALGCTRHKTGDIDELDDGRLHLLRVDDRAEFGQALIGHFDYADIRLDGAEGIVFCGYTRFGERIKQCGFSYVGQTNDTAFQAHKFIEL